MFGAEERIESLRELQSTTFDICIIGGGITGAGIARDAAMRGLKVGLIEANDFASGTSSRSSKLIHGGIRYLENLEFGLVYEALTERRYLFEMAPHLVHPLRFVLPLYRGGRVGMFMMGLGMWLYDLLALFEMPEFHEHLNPAETLRRSPTLKESGLLGSYVYSDAYMDDDRLTIETMRSAARAGANCVNYVRAVGSETKGEVLTGVVCRDEHGDGEFTVRARHFVSCVGPWTDLLGEKLLKKWDRLMRPSKGIHLTLERSRLPLKEAVVMATDDEKRIVFAIPRNDMVIIGTTDTDYAGDPADVCSTNDDVDYVLRVVDEYFPGANIGREDILASYSGVRPLVHDNSGSESATSREHLILSDERNITFVTGGKYTTYRHMAEETVERILQSFTIEEQVHFRKCVTRAPLNSLVTRDSWPVASKLVEEWAKKFNVSHEEVGHLAERYGIEAEVILEKYSQGSYWQWEANHAISELMCLNLIDFYLRRTPLFLTRKGHGHEFIDEVSLVFKERLSWSDNELAHQKEALNKHIAHEMGWQVNV